MASYSAESSDEQLVNIREFIDKWKNELPLEDIVGNRPDTLSEYMNEKMSVSAQVLSELDVVCGVDTLSCAADSRDRDTLLEDDLKNVESDLASVRYQRSELASRQNAKYKRSVHSLFKYRERSTPWKHKELASSSEMVLSMPQVLVTIEVYRPFQKGKRIIMDQEIQVLGSNHLSDIKDAIFCINDHMIPGECSEQPNVQPDLNAKDVYKSSFMFIEGTFYNDLRDISNQDNSQVIIDWAQKVNAVKYGKKKMEETQVIDLTVKLGYPYVYQHQGNCEHLILFSDIRLLHEEDCCDPAAYPLITVQKSHKRTLCRSCQMYFAKWLTKGSPLCPEDPCFFCNTCFQTFHYDVYGKKMFDFTAYRFPDKMASDNYPKINR